MIERLPSKVDRLTILSSVIIARHQTPSLIGLFVIFASFVIAIAWSDAATLKVDVTNGCDSVTEPGAILPMGRIDLLGVTLYKHPRKMLSLQGGGKEASCCHRFTETRFSQTGDWRPI